MSRGAGAGRSRVWSWALKVAFTAGSLVWVVRHVELGPAMEKLLAVDLTRFAVASLLMALTLLLAAWRWRVLLQAQSHPVSLARAADWVLVAHFFNQLLPGSVGGDAIRITDSAGLTRSAAVAALVVAFDRLLGLMALATVGCAGLALMASRGEALVAAGGALGLVGLSVTALMVADALQGRLDRARPRWGLDALRRVVGALQLFRRTPAAVAQALAGALATQSVLVAFYVAIAASIGVHLSLAQALGMVPAVMLLQALPISISGLGVREAAFAVGFTRAGLPADQGVAVSMMGFVATLLLAGIGAVRFLTRRPDVTSPGGAAAIGRADEPPQGGGVHYARGRS